MWRQQDKERELKQKEENRPASSLCLSRALSLSLYRSLYVYESVSLSLSRSLSLACSLSLYPASSSSLYLTLIQGEEQASLPDPAHLGPRSGYSLGVLIFECVIVNSK